jgi:hypothetical protein
MVIVIVWLATKEKQSRARYRADVQRDLIAKFPSGQELAEFLKTDESRRIFQELSSTPAPSDPIQKVVGIVIGGTVMSALGIGFLFLTRHEPDFIIPATIILSVGIGLLISAAVAYLLMKKSAAATAIAKEL